MRSGSAEESGAELRGKTSEGNTEKVRKLRGDEQTRSSIIIISEEISIKMFLWAEILNSIA